jgi:hypothetical protein
VKTSNFADYLPLPQDQACRELVLAVLRDGTYEPPRSFECGQAGPIISSAILAGLLRGVYGEPQKRRIRVTGVTFTGDIDLAYLDWRGELDLTGCIIVGTLLLSHARIGGTVKLDKTHVGAIDARYAVIDGAFLLRRARCAQGLYGLAMTVKGSLNLTRTEIWAPWKYPNRCAIELFRAKIGDVFFGRSVIYGGLYGNGLAVDRNLRLQGATVIGRGDMGWETGADSAAGAITLAGAAISSGLYLSWKTPSERNPPWRITGKIQLSRATCRSLHLRYSDLQDIPLSIDHFDYARLVEIAPQEWLSVIESTPNVSGQPYTRLSSYAAEVGRTDLQRDVLVALQRRITSELPPGWERMRRRLWDWTVVYGYAPGRAILWLLLCVAISVAVLRAGGSFLINDDIAKTRGVRDINDAVTLALDNLLPFAALGAARHWSAMPKNLIECVWMLAFVALKFVAWGLAGLGLASVTGIARRA